MWYKTSWRKLHKTCFVENSNFVRGSTEVALRLCFGINSD